MLTSFVSEEEFGILNIYKGKVKIIERYELYTKIRINLNTKFQIIGNLYWSLK